MEDPRLRVPVVPVPRDELVEIGAEIVASRKAELERVVVKIRPVHKGRTTTYEVECSDAEHGVFPLPCASRDAAVVVAGRHSQHEHEGRARLKIVEARRRRRTA